MCPHLSAGHPNFPGVRPPRRHGSLAQARDAQVNGGSAVRATHYMGLPQNAIMASAGYRLGEPRGLVSRHETSVPPTAVYEPFFGTQISEIEACLKAVGEKTLVISKSSGIRKNPKQAVGTLPFHLNKSLGHFSTLTGPTLLLCVVLHCAEGAIKLDSCLELFRVLGIEIFHTLVETDHFVTDHFVSVSAEQG